MIDTIKIHIPFNKLPSDYYKQNYSQFNAISTTKWGDGALSEIRMHKNFRLIYNERGLSVEGSLSKYLFGSNQYSLDLDSLLLAIERLSQELGMQLNNSKVTRIDLAGNLLTTNHPQLYFKYFGETPRFDRVEMRNGLEYRNCNRVISIYDKIKELKSNGTPISKVFEGKNMLRYEYRLKNNTTISKALKINDATVDDIIYSYQKLISAWHESFKTVSKISDYIMFDLQVFQHSKGIEKQIMLAGIEKLGGFNKFLQIVKDARKQKLFKYSNQATNIIRKITVLSKTPLLTKPSNLLLELERKIDVINLTHFSNEELYLPRST